MSGPAERERVVDAPGASEHDDGVSPLVWSVNPWRRSPVQAAAGVILTLMIAAIIFRLGLQTMAAAVLAVVLALSVAPAWLVLHCRVDEQGVGRKLGGIWTKRRWNEIRRVQVQDSTRAPGLFVSPLERPGPLDAFRGLHLPLPLDLAERARLVAGIHTRSTAHALQR